MRRERDIPLLLTGRWIKGQDTVREQVIACSLITAQIWRWVSRDPVSCVRIAGTTAPGVHRPFLHRRLQRDHERQICHVAADSNTTIHMPTIQPQVFCIRVITAPEEFTRF